MKKFLTSLDKICHILMCVLITIISATIFSKTTDISIVISAVCGVVCAGICGVLKEVVDFLRGGLFDTKDLMADGIGMVIGFMLVLFILG